jgi:hypothetical protein
VTTGRLDIQPYIDSATSVSIPLQVFQAESTAKGSKASGGLVIFKAGINVTITLSDGSSSTQMYEFDTGGKGFFASGVTVKDAVGAVANAYDSGLAYTGEATYATISFPGATPAFTLPTPVLVGIISQVTYDGASDRLPIYSQVGGTGALYGDFGASLQPSAIDAGEGNDVSLLTILAQYGSGFIVDVGPFPAGTTGSGQLVLGLTPALRSLFPNVIPMLSSGLPPYVPQGGSGAGVATFAAALLDGTLKVGQNSLTNVPIIFDTGAPHTTFHTAGTMSQQQFTPGPSVNVLLTAGANDFPILQFAAGPIAGQNLVSVQPETPPAGSSTLTYPNGYVNTGITPFFNNPILFDLENGVIGFPAGEA